MGADSTVLGPLSVRVREPLTKAEAGRLGARSRWGDGPRTVRLAELDPRVRSAVLALIHADAAAKAANDG